MTEMEKRPSIGLERLFEQSKRERKQPAEQVEILAEDYKKIAAVLSGV